jgi:hypothetical protein
MRILIDNQPCPITASCLGEALAAGNNIAEEQGRLIVEVHVDGTLLSDSDLQETERLKSDPNEVELKTTTALALLSETFARAAETIREAEKIQHQAADQLRSGSVVDGMRSLSIALESWMSVHEAVIKGLTLAGENPEILNVDGVLLPEASDALHGRLSDLRTAIAAEDSSAICDCLLYEFPTISAVWATLLSGLARRYHAGPKES